MRRAVIALVIALLVGCSSDASSVGSAPSTVPPSGGFESARIVLTQYFVGLAGGDHQAVTATVCSPSPDLDRLMTAYRAAVRESGPIRLRLASVDQDAAEGDVPFEATTEESVIELVAVLEAERSGGICLRAITSKDGTSPPLPVWVE